MSDASKLHRVKRPRRLKRVLAALREAKQPLTAADISAICNLTSSTVARLLRTLREYGYPIHARQVKNTKVTDYRLVEAPTTKRG